MNKSKYLYALTGARLILCLISDTFLVSTLPVSASLGVNGIGYSNILVNALLLLVPFYVLYAVQNVFDSTFYGLGKTNYMLFESVVTNTVYYGIAFIFYATGMWTPTLTGIALLFGIGNAFDSIVSLIVYTFLLKKEKINILKVE